MLTDKATGAPKGVAFIDFKLPVSAAAAIDAMNNQMYSGKALKVSYASAGQSKGKPATPMAFGAMPYPYMGYPDPYGQAMGYGMQYY